jgi:formylglycine-generating enzyme required for sulfatase activity
VWGGPLDPTPTLNAPRLLQGGADVTPPSAPWPLVTVDRLLYVTLPADAKKEARVTLHGACLGTSARFGDAASVPSLLAARTCIDTEKTLVPVTPIALEDAISAAPSTVGTWPNEPCATQPADAPRVCLPGAATVLGTTDLISSVEVTALPIRTFGLHRFYMDRFEVTVARYRAAKQKGFKAASDPVVNDGVLAVTSSMTNLCTWSSTPKGREDYSVNCVRWDTARAFCKYIGGDLATEAQWEHAATVAGHTQKTRYPWGNDEPSCTKAAFGRGNDASSPGQCLQYSQRPPPPKDSQNDLSPLGIMALAGGLSEWVVGKAVPYSDACWVDGPIVEPRCEPEASQKSSVLRGGTYILPQMVASTTRFVDDRAPGSYALGFRCVYAADGAP